MTLTVLSHGLIVRASLLSYLDLPSRFGSILSSVGLRCEPNEGPQAEKSGDILLSLITDSSSCHHNNVYISRENSLEI
ncbi:hypothetical protein PNOK_0936500 [Pyrrhoderma noxium]|uniref:Uncharacterized protein n=1 Tax=Pyrrhoderma noxium TaxID=2282107 RepID=A0A286U5J0_9AGAM|nr:hypothetical protein PNOK_0936500 [Pyrrhoderma noxium]